MDWLKVTQEINSNVFNTDYCLGWTCVVVNLQPSEAYLIPPGSKAGVLGLKKLYLVYPKALSAALLHSFCLLLTNTKDFVHLWSWVDGQSNCRGHGEVVRQVKTAQQAKALISQPGNLSPISEPIMEEENQFPKVFLFSKISFQCWPPHACPYSPIIYIFFKKCISGAHTQSFVFLPSLICCQNYSENS